MITTWDVQFILGKNIHNGFMFKRIICMRFTGLEPDISGTKINEVFWSSTRIFSLLQSRWSNVPRVSSTYTRLWLFFVVSSGWCRNPWHKNRLSNGKRWVTQKMKMSLDGGECTKDFLLVGPWSLTIWETNNHGNLGWCISKGVDVLRHAKS